MSEEIKNIDYEKLYSDCSDGAFHPFRDDETNFGWGIRHNETGAVFGYIGEKSCAFGVAAALNGKWDAAKCFLKNSSAIPNDYFNRFKEK